MEKQFQAYVKTPIGTARITGDQKGIRSITVQDKEVEPRVDIPECLRDCADQLEEYFAGSRKSFHLDLNPKGSAFQQRVWKELQQIPYGQTISYLDQSVALGDEKAIRAVASANAKNPLWIVVPCHRVIGSDGSLRGYAGGLWRKKWLLDHENPPDQTSLF